MTPLLREIIIYPIKSFDGVSLSAVRILPSGAIAHDREWALFDQQDRFVNGKRVAKIHQIRAVFDDDLESVTLKIGNTGDQITGNLQKERPRLQTWLSDYLGFPVQFKQNTETGFPDDTDANGPTVISTATLKAIALWYHLDLAEVRRRFRTNLEIDEVPPFWEDCLFGKDQQVIAFKIGDVQFKGINPCQRCIVPTRDTITGIPTEDFQKIFIAKRQATLPDWVEATRFNHYYRLAINTQVPSSESGKILKIGDRLINH